jgi:hypothetical protein
MTMSKKLKRTVILTAFVAIMFFGAAASTNAAISSPASISETTAAQVARFWIVTCSSTFPDWAGATVGTAVKYYSYDNVRSAYEFTLLNNGTDVGYIMVAARKDWAPILEFGGGKAPSKNLHAAAETAMVEGFLKSGQTADPVYYYNGADTAAVQLGDRMKEAKALVDLLSQQIVPKGESAVLQFDAAAMQHEWSSLLGGLPLSPASFASSDHPGTIILNAIGDLDPTDVQDVTGVEVPHLAEGEGYGDTGPDPNATFPSCVGSAPDYWYRWDGCSPTAGGAILGYWQRMGYGNLDCGTSPQDTLEALVDLCHVEMETHDDASGYTPDGDYIHQPYVSDGIRKVAALWKAPFYFGYDFDVKGRYPVWKTTIEGEIDAGRPLILHYVPGAHSVVVTGYATVPAQPFDVGFYLHVNDGWDSTANHYIQYGAWGGFGWGACITTVVPQNKLTVDEIGQGEAKAARGNSDEDVSHQKHNFGTVLTLTAEPASGWYFTGWTGDTEKIADVTSASTTIVMNSDYDVVATFAKETPLSLPNELTRVAVTSDGITANSTSMTPVLSGDGTCVAFVSTASNLLPNVTGRNVFVKNLVSHELELVSLANNGAQANGGCYEPAISESGRFVVFSSSASNLVPEGDTNNCSDVFVRDRQLGSTKRVSVTGSGEQAIGASWCPSISADGRYVSFISAASNLTPGYGSRRGAYVYDTVSGSLSLVGRDPTGGNNVGAWARISPNGEWVVYEREEILDFEPVTQLYLAPRGGSVGARITNAPDGIANGDCLGSCVADDGTVAFASWAYNLTPSDTDPYWDIYVCHPGGGIECLSYPQSGRYGQGTCSYPALSRDGRYVYFCSTDGNLVEGPTSNVGHLFVRDMLQGSTTLLSKTASGAPANGMSFECSSSHDGASVVFTTRARNLVLPDRPAAVNYEVVALSSSSVSATRDSDGDGLFDVWERTGDTDNDGFMEINLPAMGADPMHKDVFVEIDWMECESSNPQKWYIAQSGNTHSHKPNPLALQWVVQAFADAPVNNPDGTTGINLHIDAGPDSQMTPGEAWGNRSGSNAVDGLPNLMIGNGSVFSWVAFNLIKSTPGNFDLNRRAIFHYSIYAHSSGPASSTGVSRGKPGSDFIVAAGSDTWRLSAQQEAGTFMHELGHNLALNDGGGDPVKYKPNYLSVMNYTFQLTGLIQQGGTGWLSGATGILDYSRSALDSLNEHELNEALGLTPAAGLTGRGGAQLGTRWWVSQTSRIWVPGGSTAIDWDGNGTIDAYDPYRAPTDINRDNYYGNLTGYNDWASVQFRGGSIGDYGAPLPETTEDDEITYQEFVDRGIDHGPYAVRVSTDQGATVFPGWRGTLSITIENFGDLADTYDVEVVSSSSLFEVSRIPQQVALQAGEQLGLHIDLNVPLTQPDGELGMVRVVVTSTKDSHSLGMCAWTIKCRKPTVAESMDVLEAAVAGLGSLAEQTPIVSSVLTSAAECVLPDEAPADGAALIGSLNQAVVLVWEAIDELAEADVQSGNTTHADTIEQLRNYSGLLVTVAGNLTGLAIEYQISIAGGYSAESAASQAQLAEGDEAFSQGDHLAAVAHYLEAVATNQTPVIEITPLGIHSEGTALSGVGSFADPDSTSWTATVNYGDGSGAQPLVAQADKTFTLSHIYADDGTYTITVDVVDDNGAVGTAAAAVSIANAAPVISSFTGPMDPRQVGTSLSVEFPFTDAGALDSHTYEIAWGDGMTTVGTPSGRAGTSSHIYSIAGVYTPVLTVTDDDGGSTSSSLEAYLVVYDPDGGFVTGGGWITSPPGAYASDPNLTGKATFGFVSKYQHGAQVPTGNTEFQFRTADFNFRSASYEWLVVAGTKAKYKGSGTINGTGDYAFMISAIDGQVSGGVGIDKFRIKIWSKTSGGVIYDNQMGAAEGDDPTTSLGGGSIVVHKD